MPRIAYEFVASGQGDITAAFRSISAEARASKSATDGMYRASVIGSAQATRAAQTYGREAKRPISDLEKVAKRVAADQEKAAKRAADVEIKEAKRAADAKIKAQEHVYQIRRRHEEQVVRQEKAAQTARDARIRSVGQTIGRGILGAGVGLAVGTGATIGAAARESMKLQDVANRISINARGAGERAIDPTVLRKEFEATAIANPGQKAADIAEGVGGFIAKTGDLKAARQFSGTFATTASATGADVQDIANAAADIFQKFDVTGVDEMREALAKLTFQGKSGAFELKDAASQFAKMSAAAERFGLAKGAKGLATLGGLTQIARSATGSPEQAATAVEAMFRQLTGAHSGKLLAQSGVQVFEKGSTSKTRDIRDILSDTISKTGGSLTKLGAIFGEEGIRGISPLISTFNQARDKAKGEGMDPTKSTAAGVTALRSALEKAIDAPGNWAEVVRDAAQAQSSSSSKVTAAWEKIKAAVGDKFAPQIAELAGKLAENKSAFDALVLAVKAAVAVLDFFGKAAKGAGLVEDDFAGDKKTNEDKAKAADQALMSMLGGKDIATPEGKAAFKKLTPEDQARASSLYVEQSVARKGAAFATSVMADQDRAKLFAERYSAATGPDAKVSKEFMLTRGKQIAAEYASGEGAEKPERIKKLGESEAQTNERHAFEQKTGVYAPGKTDGAADKLIAAADKLSASADKIASGQPSITGAPLVGGTQ